MKLLLLVAIVALSPLLAAGQARTAERIVSIPFSQLDPSGNLPNGEVRHVINGLQGSTPCTAGGTGAIAYKIAGQWQCPKLTPGVGAGDVLGAASSTNGELVVYSGTSGRALGRSSGLTGIPLLASGIPTMLSSTGTGSVVRDTGGMLTNPVLVTPAIASFANATHLHNNAAGGGQLNASNVFSGGTIPPDRIISGTITNSRCLRVSNVGQIEVAANDCGAGGGGSPGGVSGNLTFNESGAFGGLSNTAYDAVTGRLSLIQKANGNDLLSLFRFTDTSPTGNLLRVRNATNTSDLFRIGADGVVGIAGPIVVNNATAPATPAAGTTVLWTDATDKNLRAQDDAGNVSGTVRAITCSGTDKISSISSAGVPVCTADQGGTGTGVITFNGLNSSDQTVVTVDDANIDLTWGSSVSVHTLTVAWLGRLDAARMDVNTVLNDTANTWTTGAQDFGSAASLKVPSATGASPSANGLVAFDLTSFTLEYGENGTNRVIANTAGSQTLSNKTLDNSTTANLRDTLLTLQDNVDSTKTVNFELSAVASGANRVVSIPNANTTTVQPTTATTNQFVTHIDSSGVVQKAQPSFSNLSGSMGPTQGGTGLTAVAQGDLLYGDATNSWARLAKSASATRYLSNTGASNNPAWAQVDLTNGVTGVLPPANWSVLTTKGDLLVHNGTTSVRQAVGTNGFALLADSTQTSGVRWGAITATPGGSTTQLQANLSGSLAGISGATTDGTSVTFAPANIIIGGQSAAPTAVAGAFYRDTDDSKLYWAKDGSTWGEVFVAGLSTVSLTANVSGILPLANGGTNQASWTASRCVQVNSGGTALEAASAACGTSSITGSDTHVLFFDGANNPAGEAGMTYAKATDTLTVGAIVTAGSGAGYLQLAPGTAPTVVASEYIYAAPATAPGGGLLYLLPSDTPSNGEQLTANISGTTVTLSWDAAGSGGTGDAVSVNGSAATDANFIATTASGTVPSITWTLNTATTPDEISIATVGAASATEAGVITTGAQTLAGKKTFSPTSTTAGVNVGSVAGDPSTPANGDLWYDSTANELTARINGANVALGAGGGGGSGTINSGVTNVIPKYTASTTIDDSLLSDDGTTVAYSGTGGLSLTATGGGFIQFTEGTQPAIVANTVQHAAATDAPAAGVQYLWGSTAAGSGVLRVVNTSGVMAVTQDAGISHLASSTSADLAGVLSDEQGTAGGFVRATSPTLTTPVLGVATATSINGLTITTSTGTLTIANAKTATINNSITFAGTDSTTMTFPSTTATIARTDAAQTFTGTQTFGAVVGTTWNGNTWATGTGTLSIGAGKTATISNTLTFAGTDSTTQTFQASDTIVGRATTDTLTNKTYDTEGTGNVFTSAHKIFLPAAGCLNTTAVSFWDLPTSSPAAAACVSGTNIQKGVLDFADTAGGFRAQTTLALPSDFTGTIDARILWTTTATSGNVKWSLLTICTAVDATETDDPAFNTASTATTAAPGVASRVQTSSITSVTITGCAANELLHVGVFRDGNDAADTVSATVRLVGVELTVRRAQ